MYYRTFPINKQAFNSLDEELKACLFFLACSFSGPPAFGFPDKQGWVRKLACLFYLGCGCPGGAGKK